MCMIRCEEIMEWLPFEKIVRIRAADGALEELSVPNDLLKEKLLKVHRIGSKDTNVLVELPRETSSGTNRVWVSQSNIVEGSLDDSNRSRDACRV